MNKSLNISLCVLCIAASCVCLALTVLLILEIDVVTRTMQSFFGRSPSVVQQLHQSVP